MVDKQRKLRYTIRQEKTLFFIFKKFDVRNSPYFCVNFFLLAYNKNRFLTNNTKMSFLVFLKGI